MRTTLVIEDDVLDRARDLAQRRRIPFRQVVNEALRAGLSRIEAPTRSQPYRTVPRDLGLQDGVSLDNIQALLERINPVPGYSMRRRGIGTFFVSCCPKGRHPGIW